MARRDVRVVVRFVELTGSYIVGDSPPPGAYLVSFDANAHDGRGAASWTTDWTKAHVFDSAVDALATWKRQSTLRPQRDDGQPNRPLTSATIEVVPFALLVKSN